MLDCPRVSPAIPAFVPASGKWLDVRHCPGPQHCHSAIGDHRHRLPLRLSRRLSRHVLGRPLNDPVDRKFTYPDTLLELVNQVVHEADEILIGRQQRHPVFVVGHDKLQLLESVWKNVQYERRRVLDVHAWMLTKLHHLVHHFPRLVDRLAVNGYQTLRPAGVRQRSLDQSYQFLAHVW